MDRGWIHRTGSLWIDKDTQNSTASVHSCHEIHTSQYVPLRERGKDQRDLLHQKSIWLRNQDSNAHQRQRPIHQSPNWKDIPWHWSLRIILCGLWRSLISSISRKIHRCLQGVSSYRPPTGKADITTRVEMMRQDSRTANQFCNEFKMLIAQLGPKIDLRWFHVHFFRDIDKNVRREIVRYRFRGQPSGFCGREILVILVHS